jgi:hypothetical protein
LLITNKTLGNNTIENYTMPAFIGYTEKAECKGQSLVMKPWRISSITEFEDYFGSLSVQLINAIRYYYQNGGDACYILSLGSYDENDSRKEEYSLVLIPRMVSLDAIADCAVVHNARVQQENEVVLEIAVAPDEESAKIILHIGTKKYIFPPRVHYYLLAFLARENSWVDCELICKELMMSRELLTQQVFRIRQDIKEISPLIADKIIDRSLRSKMRIGIQSSNTKVFTMV